MSLDINNFSIILSVTVNLKCINKSVTEKCQLQYNSIVSRCTELQIGAM